MVTSKSNSTPSKKVRKSVFKNYNIDIQPAVPYQNNGVQEFYTVDYDDMINDVDSIENLFIEMDEKLNNCINEIKTFRRYQNDAFFDESSSSVYGQLSYLEIAYKIVCLTDEIDSKLLLTRCLLSEYYDMTRIKYGK